MVAMNYVAELKNVREVSLLGSADLKYWKDQLSGDGTAVDAVDGNAQIIVIGVEARYLGIKFREISLSVVVRPVGNGISQLAVLLMKAFNSSRLLAFAERRLFGTPYSSGEIEVGGREQPFLRLELAGQVALETRMSLETRDRLNTKGEDGGWEGAVLLRRTPRDRANQRRMFFARLKGPTQTCPFDSSRDSFHVDPVAGGDVFRWLSESGFSATEWTVRENAAHARSKTYREEEGWHSNH
jgi:hypothetical protein